MKFIQDKKIRFEYQITIIYLIIGILWIVFSDMVLESVLYPKNISLLTSAQSYKGIFYIFITSLLLFVLVKGHLKKLKKSETKLQEQIKKFELLNQEYKSLNQELEQRVLDRTSQLEASNKELEAFSYSVSHDLRAPLRHINGYIDLLKRRFPDSLPEKGQQYLDNISESAIQMGQLIDELLQFSRTSRQELKYFKLNMNALTEEAIKMIQYDNVGRKIDWLLKPLPEVWGDSGLLKMVWINLLSNAAKFTRKKEKALIEIECNDSANEFIFSVRDNGAGFDMKYAQKLFGVFQRLHSVAEYEGTGIGLANVQRIISRHGGRIWAEAQVDKGAIFYFTLPKNKKQS